MQEFAEMQECAEDGCTIGRKLVVRTHPTVVTADAVVRRRVRTASEGHRRGGCNGSGHRRGESCGNGHRRGSSGGSD